MKNKRGFTLMEVVVSILIISVVIMGILSLIVYSIHVTNDNKLFVEAIEISSQKMEQIRNLPYDDVGTLTGSPHGVIPQDEEIIREGTFHVYTAVTFFDDEYDGTLDLGNDPVFLDYKIATVEISWESSFGPRNVTVFSKIIPNTEENLTGYGLIKLLVNDIDGAPVPYADVHVENNIIAPILNADYVTDGEGKLTLAVLPAQKSYEITATKAGYSTDKTYTEGEIIRGVSNDDPTRPHWSVYAESKTEDSLSIDLLGELNIRLVSTNQPDNNLINEERPAREQLKPKMSSDASGNIYFAWEDYSATSSYVYVQKYDSSFNKQWASDHKIYTTDFQTNPDIVTSSGGNSFVAWQDNSSALKLITKNNNSTNKYATDKINGSDTKFFPTAKNYFIKIFSRVKLKIGEKIKNGLAKISTFDFFNKKAEAAGEQVVYVGSGPGATTGNSRIINLSVPAGVQEDDFLLAFIHHDDTADGPINPPSGEGWNILNNNMDPSGSSSNSRGAIFWKIADSSEPSYYTFTLSGNNEEKAGHIRAYRGVNPANPFDGSLNWTTIPYWNSLFPAPSHTVNNDGSMLVCGWGTDLSSLGNNNPTYPSGMSHGVNSNASNITAVAADEPVDSSDSPTGTKTLNARQWVTNAAIAWCLVIKPEVIPNNITISASESQISTATIPTADFYIGGKFVATENYSSRNITSVSINEYGSVDAENSLSNARLYYDFDNTFPYNCEDQIYNPGSDSQFGIAEEFDGADGSAQFTGSAQVSTTQSLCFYLVLDVDSSALSNDTIEIKIANPSTDITVDSGSVLPDTTIEIAGETLLLKPAELSQIHYRFRNDDNNEENATWMNNIDAPEKIIRETPLRLRFEMSNEGDQSSTLINYKIEYGERTASCADISSWHALPSDNSLHWRMIDSTHFTDSDPTTNISNGLTDENLNFVSGEIKDTSNQTSPIQLSSSEFTEIEFSIEATNNSIDGDYCFRLTDAGSTDGFAYAIYPEISVIGDENIYIISLDASANENWSVVRVNSDSSSADQTEPRIAFTENFGDATTTVVWTDERNGNQDIYAQGIDFNGNKIWASDLNIASQVTNENSPDICIDGNDNIYVVWVNEDVSKDIYAQKFNLSGVPQWGANINLISSTTDEYDPSIVCDSGGNFFISWTEIDGAVEKAYLAKYDSSASNLWKTQANAEYASGPQSETSIMINGFYLYISWTDEREGNEDIYAQKYDLNGNSQWVGDLRVNINSGTSIQNKSFLNYNSSGDNYAVWQDERNSRYDIYATKFFDSSTLNGVADVPIVVTGTKQVGDDPVIYKFVEEFSSDSSGYVNIPVEWDTPGYSIELKTGSTPYELIMSSPVQPFEIMPAETKDILLYVR